VVHEVVESVGAPHFDRPPAARSRVEHIKWSAFHSTQANTMPEVLDSTFVLAVRHLSASVRFYVEKLGFAEELRVDGWAFLRRGACRLRLGHCPDAVPMTDTPDHLWFAYLHVYDAAGLYRTCLANGVDIWHPLADKPWGMREFAVVTPDGHRIVFGEKLPVG
jgi:catechol 2,3-dioxygenase-like lactoylglutathione lyase family enzyme